MHLVLLSMHDVAAAYSLHGRCSLQSSTPYIQNMSHVFRVYAGMNFLAACSIGVFTILEARDPMVRSPLEPLEDWLVRARQLWFSFFPHVERQERPRVCGFDVT